MQFLRKLEEHLAAPKANVNLELFDKSIVLGDNLEGAITVLPYEDFEAEEIHCEINCVQDSLVLKTDYDLEAKSLVARQKTENRVLYQTKTQCSPATALYKGKKRAFLFSINIPAGAHATSMSAAELEQWEITGVIAVHGRPEITTKEQQFQVVAPNQRSNEPQKASAKNYSQLLEEL